jgi:integrase
VRHFIDAIVSYRTIEDRDTEHPPDNIHRFKTVLNAMQPTRLSLTDKTILALPFMTSGQRLVRDAELSGFFVVVGKRTKTFMVQADLRANGKRRSVRIKVGEVGELNTREARAKAKALLGSIAKGVDPRGMKEADAEGVDNGKADVGESGASGPTLRAAWTRYRDAHLKRKGRSEGTIENFRDHVERLMADWLDQPLSVLGDDPSFVALRHEKITAENGPYIANGAMRSLRAIYNHARKTTRSLPAENPVIAVDWNVERRRNTALGLAELDSWIEDLRALENPIRREFHLFVLLSGSRPDALKRSRVEHVNFRARILHIPRPKGGEDKAFDIPLSRAMINCLVRVIRLGRVLYPTQALEWLFPADGGSGHIVEHKEDRTRLAKWGNDLRQTYRTVAQTVGIGDLDIHLLMNHTIAGVNAGYITRSKLLSDHLRRQQHMISRKMIDAFRSRPQGNKQRHANWPLLPARAVLKDAFQAAAPDRRAKRTSKAELAEDGKRSRTVVPKRLSVLERAY